MLLASAVLEHNSPVAFADHFESLLKCMCPDLKIAEKLSCVCTKTTSLINFLADDSADAVSEVIKTGPGMV